MDYPLHQQPLGLSSHQSLILAQHVPCIIQNIHRATHIALHQTHLSPPMHTLHLVKEGGEECLRKEILARMSVIRGVVNRFLDFLTPPKHTIACMYLITNILLQNLMDIKPSRYFKRWVRPYLVWFFIEKLINHVHNKFLLKIFTFVSCLHDHTNFILFAC